MAKAATRFMLTIPADMAQRAEALKKELFDNKSYAEMYRQFIQLGMDEMQERLEREDRQQSVS